MALSKGIFNRFGFLIVHVFMVLTILIYHNIVILAIVLRYIVTDCHFVVNRLVNTSKCNFVNVPSPDIDKDSFKKKKKKKKIIVFLRF